MAVLLATVFLPGSGDASADDRLAGDLFSKITMSETTSSSLRTPTGKRNEILGVVSLSKLLLTARIKSEVQSQTVLVRLADLSPGLAQAGHLGELRLSVDAELNRIDLVLPLRKITDRIIADKASVQGPKLMSLLIAVSDISGIQLTASGQSIALHASLTNQEVTCQGIRAVAERLVAATKKTEPILSAIVESVQPDAQPTNLPTKLDSSVKPLSVVGTWSSRTSAQDAWAIRFEADNSFVMVHTRSGKNAISKGNYQATENRLVVSETGGVTLKGQLERSGEKAFSWKLQNESGQTMATLPFKKQ